VTRIITTIRNRSTIELSGLFVSCGMAMPYSIGYVSAYDEY
jgi:hypothetical protein